jgi:ribosomal protein S18 acetylase RimI-like enzyme
MVGMLFRLPLQLNHRHLLGEFMDHAFSLQIDSLEYPIAPLKPELTGQLQALFERCPDFAQLVEGEGVSPSAAQDTFEALPPGKTLDDKFLYGVFTPQGELCCVLEGIRDYPEAGVWWIGLLLIDPAVRRHGLGQKLVQRFCDHVRSAKGNAVMLGVVEENQPAFQFWKRQGFELVRTTEPRPFGKKIQKVLVMRKTATDF